MTQFNTYDLKEIIEKKGSVLAFDLGIKKIGVAEHQVCKQSTKISEILNSRNGKKLCSKGLQKGDKKC